MDKKKIEDAVRTIIEAVGDDPERGGLKDTPAREARTWLRSYCSRLKGFRPGARRWN